MPPIHTPALRRHRPLAALCLALAVAGCAHAPSAQPTRGWGALHADTASLSPARAQDTGFSPERLARLDAAMAKEIAEKRLPGAVIGIARNGRLVHTFVGGVQDPSSGAPMARDSIFRMYSMTKAMVVATALTLMEEGRLQLTDPVSRYLPPLKTLQVSVPQRDATTGATGFRLVSAERDITILDLMRHTSGLTYGERSPNKPVHEAYKANGLELAPFKLTRAQFVDGLARSPLMAQPGTTFEYGLSTDLLGAVIEAITGQRLSVAMRERLWAPLKMADTAFWVDASRRSRLAQPFAVDPADGSKPDLHGLDTLATEPAFDSGGAGSVSTLADYMRFTQMLLNGGTLDGVRVLSRTSVQLMASDHIDSRIGNPMAASLAALGTAGYSHGLGVGVRTADGAGLPGSVGEITWAGTGGTYFWVDPKEQLAVVYLTQRPGASRSQYRRLIRQLVYQAIAD
ncbi:MAG: serine hydrolase domain-containing protein [Rubrivivax sp.]